MFLPLPRTQAASRPGTQNRHLTFGFCSLPPTVIFVYPGLISPTIKVPMVTSIAFWSTELSVWSTEESIKDEKKIKRLAYEEKGC